MGWRIGEMFTPANGLGPSIEKVRFFFLFYF